ncbi:MAG: FkbM family methyltransferase [Rhodospirillaceae bacterium]|jgi:FkbM family methyltransferase|nr:FkbM family methyltransferase [Rhodospirillaceae bacterium]MBT5239703.1 FkbM family methyltransferase [Rhodospirillaceae bacterium]MBT5567267.1 FkbM family methyltransferase [Rhodospirillaceae bacterium]
MLRDALGEIIGQLTPEIAQWPRREPGEMLVAGKFLKYADMHSFYYQTRQIFGDRLYHFDCDTEAPFILDCGAHIGMASLFFKEQYPNARIRAFEADPKIASLCEANLTAFGHGDIAVDALAVWIGNDGVTFTDSKDDAGHVDDVSDAGISVPTIRLKDVIEKDRIQLLKLDVEGAEYKILADCGDSLRNVERMVVEVHAFRQEDGKLGALLAQLEELGFRYVLDDLHQATWMEPDKKPPFTMCSTDKYIVTVFAWQGECV